MYEHSTGIASLTPGPITDRGAEEKSHPISYQLKNVLEAVDHIETNVEALIQDIMPVIRMEPSSEAKPAEQGTPPIVQSDLADALVSIYKRLNLISLRVGSVRKNIDL